MNRSLFQPLLDVCGPLRGGSEVDSFLLPHLRGPVLCADLDNAAVCCGDVQVAGPVHHHFTFCVGPMLGLQKDGGFGWQKMIEFLF